MVKTEIEYFQITLANNQKTIKIGEKEIPIIGVFLSNNDLHEILSGKKILKNIKGKKLDKLSYIALEQIPTQDVKKLEEFVFGLTMKEKMDFSEEMNKLEQNLEDEMYLDGSNCLGDRMTRRLLVNAKRSKENERKGQ